MIAFFCLFHAAAAELTFGDALARVEGSASRAQVDAEEGVRIGAARADAAWRDNPSLAGELRPDEQELTLTVPLDLAAPARGHAAGLEVDAARRRAAIGRAAVAAAVGAAWLDARRLADHAGLWRDLAARSGTLAEHARARLAAGEWAAMDAAMAGADGASLLDRSLRAELAAGDAVRRLCVLVGDPVGDTPALGPWPALAVPPEPDVDALPAVLAADLDARAALAHARAATLDRLPRLDVDAGYVVGDTEGPTVGLALEIPLFAPRAAAARTAFAQADLAEALRRTTAAESTALALGAREELAVAVRVADAWAAVDLSSARADAEARLAAGELGLAEFLALRDRTALQAAEAVDARWRLERARLALWELAARIPEETHP